MLTQLPRFKARSTPGPDRIPNIVFKLFAFEISIPACATQTYQLVASEKDILKEDEQGDDEGSC